MKLSDKSTLFFIVIVVLVAVNIGLVTFMWFSQRHGNNPDSPATADVLVKELGFDKTQEEQYRQLQRQLGDSLRPIRENERHIHDRFFEMMHASNPDSTLVALTIDSMGHIRAQIEYFTFTHFRQVRAMCNTEQKEKFDHIITETMRRMGPPPPRRGHEGPERPPREPGN
jgi:periplasmic protein CpxP/Spy